MPPNGEVRRCWYIIQDLLAQVEVLVSYLAPTHSTKLQGSGTECGLCPSSWRFRVLHIGIVDLGNCWRAGLQHRKQIRRLHLGQSPNSAPDNVVGGQQCQGCLRSWIFRTESTGRPRRSPSTPSRDYMFATGLCLVCCPRPSSREK